jgi:hypothetical protein
VWPSKLTVSEAYLDQLERSKAISSAKIGSLRKAIVHAEKSQLNAKDAANLKKLAPTVETDASSAKDPADAKRLHELAKILDSPTA